MSRLIDADLLSKEILDLNKWLMEREKAGHGTTLGELLEKVECVVSNQPTAFDKNKVAEKIIENSKCLNDENGVPQQMIYTYRAIQIVRTARASGMRGIQSMERDRVRCYCKEEIEAEIDAIVEKRLWQRHE